MSMREILESGERYTRPQLCSLTGKGDREVRNEIRSLRREGQAIMSLPDGGYKLATTAEEKQEMLRQLKGRAMDLLKTYRMTAKAMQVDGQITVAELLEAVKGEAE